MKPIPLIACTFVISTMPAALPAPESVFDFTQPDGPRDPEMVRPIGRSILAKYIVEERSSKPSSLHFYPEISLLLGEQGRPRLQQGRSFAIVISGDDEVEEFLTYLERPDAITIFDATMTFDLVSGSRDTERSHPAPRCGLTVSDKDDPSSVVFRMSVDGLLQNYIDFHYTNRNFRDWLLRHSVEIEPAAE